MKKRDRKNRKSKLSPLAKIAIVLAVVAATGVFASSSFFNVDDYEVEGNSYYSKEEILIMGDCKTGGNMFFDVSTKDIKERLQKDAYMEKVKVKRIFPNTIKIELTERKQTAAVVYGDNYVVIDDKNIVLRKSSVAPKLPLIQGVTISKIEVGQAIEIEEKVQFRQTLELIQIMEENDMYFKKIVVSPAEIKAYVLDNLVCEGAAADVMASVKAGELQKVIRGLFDLKIERGTVKVSGKDYISFSPEIA